MLMNRTRRVVPAFGLVGALLAIVLAGAAGAASPPVGDWRMNEGSGTILVDSSTFGNNGTISREPDLGRRPARPGDPLRRHR